MCWGNWILEQFTTDEACKGLSEEGQQRVHLGEGVWLPRVTLQHGPAGGHVQSGCIHGVHSGVLRSLRETRPRQKKSHLKLAKSQGGWRKYKLAWWGNNQSLQRVNAGT